MSIRDHRQPSRTPWWAKPWLILVILPALALVVMGVNILGVLNNRPKPEEEVRALLDAQAEAWNRGDLDGFMAGYWESEELRFASGDKVRNGFAATKAGYFKRYKAEGKEMGHLTFSEVTVEMISPELALVRGRWHLKFEKPEPTFSASLKVRPSGVRWKAGAETDEPHGLYTLTVKKLPVGWRVTSDHTSAAEKE